MSEPVLRVAGLEKRYSEEGPAALGGVTFDVLEGELLVIVEPVIVVQSVEKHLLDGLSRRKHRILRYIAHAQPAARSPRPRVRLLGPG